MRVIVSDSSPTYYLVLTEYIDLLPRMFDTVLLPSAMRQQHSSSDAPARVQSWLAAPPDWLEIVRTEEVISLPGLHKGESVAIKLAQAIHADLPPMDERKGVKVARDWGLRDWGLDVTGILGLLERAEQ